jgi:hypothetical protein
MVIRGESSDTAVTDPATNKYDGSSNVQVESVQAEFVAFDVLHH